MKSEFEKGFDKYAYQIGRWAYDNGWGYAGQFFGAAYVGEMFDGTEDNSLLMLREGDDPEQTYVFHKHKGQLTEIWSGPVRSTQDFDRMMHRVSEYSVLYKKSVL